MEARDSQRTPTESLPTWPDAIMGAVFWWCWLGLVFLALYFLGGSE